LSDVTQQTNNVARLPLPPCMILLAPFIGLGSNFDGPMHLATGKQRHSSLLSSYILLALGGRHRTNKQRRLSRLRWTSHNFGVGTAYFCWHVYIIGARQSTPEHQHKTLTSFNCRVDETVNLLSHSYRHSRRSNEPLFLVIEATPPVCRKLFVVVVAVADFLLCC
jgi:hypothetical protein